jgi:hypothetical protein
MRFDIVLAPEAVADLRRRRIASARKSLRARRGVRLEDVK